MSLYQLAKDKRAVVERLPAIGLLNSLGLREGVTISVVTRHPLGGPVVVNLGNRSIAIAKAVAEAITVREVTPCAATQN